MKTITREVEIDITDEDVYDLVRDAAAEMMRDTVNNLVKRLYEILLALYNANTEEQNLKKAESHCKDCKHWCPGHRCPTLSEAFAKPEIIEDENGILDVVDVRCPDLEWW